MRWSAIPALLFLTGCSFIPAAFTHRNQNADLVQGPPIQDVVTSFDRALTCLNGKVPHNVVFGVGTVVDATGKESYADGNAGKFVTQGAGEMVQSALFKAGVSVVNRRDDAITITETNWGIRDITRQVPVNFYVSGSINSLDFIPGGGFSAQVAGFGPRYRQSRILVALDLTMTDAYTGRIVANIPLQKQIFTSEIGGSGNSFFGDTLVQLDAGGMQREAINFALRQMISLATFEILGQIMDQGTFTPCKALIGGEDGGISASGTADPEALKDAVAAMKEAATDNRIKPLTVPVQQAAPPAPKGQPAAAPAPAQAPAAPPVSPAAFKAQKATQAATMAIRAANDSMAATDTKTAVEKAAEALKLSNLALLLLKEAASEGFGGDEGEVAAVVVQQALAAAKEAGTAAAKRAQDAQPQADSATTTGAGPTAAGPVAAGPTATTSAPAVPAPGSLSEQQKPGASK